MNVMAGYTRVLIYLVLATGTGGCYTLQLDNIQYNSGKGIYEYPVNKDNALSLRNNKSELVDKSNYNDFSLELERARYRYPFGDRLERSAYLKSSDYRLSAVYSSVSEKISEGRYIEAIQEIQELKRIYPGIIEYSDCLFLEAYCLEKTRNPDAAKLRYHDFLVYSSGKYSERFRGYRDADIADSIFIEERKYARNFLESQEQETDIDFFPVITPKYHYSSFHPGYNMNKEDLSRGTRGFLWLLPEYYSQKDFLLGIQTYYKLNNWLDINPGLIASGNYYGASLAFPVQLIRSENNSFAVKFSPFFLLTYANKLKFASTDYKVEQYVYNMGFKASMGIYFNQKLSMGLYYTYNLHNYDNPLRLKKALVDVWWENIYDISLYYNIFKTYSLKAGLRNDGFAWGFLLNGWEFGYDVTHSDLYLSIALY